MNRREFLKLGSLAAVSAAAGCRSVGCRRSYDDNLTVFISDVHAKPDTYQLGRFERVIDEILAMDPLPRRVVCLGDLAWCYGCRADYEATRPLFDRLTAAGIELTLGMGNHDHRANFLAVWPEYRRRLLVADRIVSETSLGTCDLILLDTLWEDHLDETRMTKVNGELSPGQLDWLKAELPKRTRPFFLAAHHPVKEIENGDWKALNDLIVSTPNCIGWLHGHDHVWKNGLLTPCDSKWGDNAFKRWLCFPSTGHWGDIGYVAMRTGEGLVRADLVMLDRYYPNPDRRMWIDAELLREKQGLFCTFRWL